MEIKVGEKTYQIKKPSYKDLTSAQVHAGKTFNEARSGNCILRDNLSNYLKEQGIWTDQDDLKLLNLTMEINDNITELKKGKLGKFKKMSEAREAAINTRMLRMDQMELISKQKKLDLFTAEAQADNARFDYLASTCILDENGNKAFSDLDDYLEKSEEEWVKKCAEELTYYIYPHLERDWEDKFPENRFLKKHNLINENGRLVNTDGKLVDSQFRLINEEGDWVDEDGNLVNSQGERIDEDGDPVSKYEEFENDLE